MANKTIEFRFVAPTDNAFEIELSGGFQGDGLHIHQHTGNPGANTHLAHFEAVDSDVLPLCLVHPTEKQLRISNILDTKFVDFTVDSSEDLTIDPSGTGKVIINSELNMATNKITGVVDPTANQEVATKKYVDDEVAGVTGLWEVDGGESQLIIPDDIDLQGFGIFNIDNGCLGSGNCEFGNFVATDTLTAPSYSDTRILTTDMSAVSTKMGLYSLPILSWTRTSPTMGTLQGSVLGITDKRTLNGTGFFGTLEPNVQAGVSVSAQRHGDFDGDLNTYYMSGFFNNFVDQGGYNEPQNGLGGHDVEINNQGGWTQMNASPIVDITGGNTCTYNLTGQKVTIFSWNPTVTSGTLIVNYKGFEATGAGTTTGTTTGTAFYADVDGYDTNWGFYNATTAHNFMGGDNSITKFGATDTDLQISSDGTNGVINVNTGITGTAIKDEDNMASDSAVHLATQQSIKKYVDDSVTPHTPEGTAVKSTGENGATKFLREDGDGTCSWQTPAGGAATKEFFIHAPDPSGTLQDGHLAEILTSTGSLFFEFYVPSDFTSLTEAVIAIIPDTDETIQFDVNITHAAVGEIGTTHQQNIIDGTQVVEDTILDELDISAPLSQIVAGDYVSVRFASDTTSIKVIGLRFKYT